MKLKLLFSLLLAMLASVDIAAQGKSEQTAPPVIEVVEYDDYVSFDFTCEDDVYELNIYLYLNGVYQGDVGGRFPWGTGAKGYTSSYRMDRTYETQYVEMHVQAWGNNGRSESVNVEYTITPLLVTERTSAPIVSGRYNPDYYEMVEIGYYDWYAIDIDNTDVEDVIIQYRYHLSYDWDRSEFTSDWKQALPGNGVIAVQESAWGWVEAFAKAENKFESDTVRVEFYFTRYPSIHYQRYYDFFVDGIYYSILSNSTVAVSKHTIDETVVFDPYNGRLLFDVYDGEEYDMEIWRTANPCYYNDIIIPSTVEYNGNTYTVTALNDYAFEFCDLTGLQLPNTITTIGNCAFYASHIPNFTIPSSVTSIGDGAFSHFMDFSTLTIPESITSIADAAFGWCEELTSVSLPESVTDIGVAAFRHCYNLIEIDIPGSVTSIGDGAFNDCTGLESVICRASTPPECMGVFECYYEYGEAPIIYDQATLFVPEESKTLYREHEEWGRFSRIVPFLGAGPGDINGDGMISISDATLLIDLLLSSGNDKPSYADVDGNGAVSIRDVTVLIDRLLANP